MDLKLSLKQKQILSNRMQLSLKILQMNTFDLGTYINDIALENPVMDISQEMEGESIDEQRWLNSLNEENYYIYHRQNNDDEYDPKCLGEFSTDQGETLQEYLWSQLVSRHWTETEKKILDFIMESLDNRGYLTETADGIAECLKTDSRIVENMISEVKSLEPAGVGAADLRECLKLQLKARHLLTPVMIELIDRYLDQIANNQISHIAAKMHISAGEVAEYVQIIRSLNPKPGSAFYSHETMKYIIPDVTIVRFEDHFDILLNESSCPKVSVNAEYREMYRQTDDSELKEYLKSKIQQTEWIEQCVSQRQKKLMSISKAILENQEEFFLYGSGDIHPFRMEDASRLIGVNVSTVSRAVNNKFLQCSWGVYPMKFFFPRSVGVPDKDRFSEGKSGFTDSDIKRVMRRIIESEDHQHPYSDRLISELLAGEGITISRRTVAKYRMEEGIPGQSGRKA